MRLNQQPTKSVFQQRLEKAFPWMLFGILVMGLLIHAALTIQYRTEDRLAEKRACQDGTADVSVNCSVYFGPAWMGTTDQTTLLAAP